MRLALDTNILVYAEGLNGASMKRSALALLEKLPQNDEVLPLEKLERRAILRVLQEVDGDKLAAARLLGIGKTTLYRKLKQYEFQAQTN